MIALIQRVNKAHVEVNNQIVGQVGHGILVFLGVEKNDTQESADKLLKKVLNYRIFEDDNGKMNRNVTQENGELLIVSQFTLAADTSSGNRPSFSKGASPDLANDLYTYFCQQSQSLIHTQTGIFGADMQVSLTNSGPVTFWLQVKD